MTKNSKKLPPVVFDVNNNGWRPLVNDAYDMTVLYKKQAAVAHLVSRCGYTPMEAKIETSDPAAMYLIYGADMRPGLPSLFIDPDTNHPMVNTWVPPTLVPKEAPFPTIDRVLTRMTQGDAEGREWLVQKLAQKYRHPDLVSKVAIVFSTTQGAGKGFLFRVMSEMLGPRNCAIVTQGELESRFSGRYARMLLLLGDEVTSSENIRDISQKLKVLIDGGEIEMERKYENSVAIRSRMMWMFASNDPVSPVALEGSDRRYTFFANFDPIEPDYTAALDACFEEDRVTPTPAFLEEIAGFAYYLKGVAVDTAFVSRPYRNAAREALIDVNRPSHEAFFHELTEIGFDAMYEAASERNFLGLRADRKDWDFGDRGVAFATLYKVYRDYCKETGQQPLKKNKFGGAVRNHVPKWEQVRNETSGGKVVRCYLVPRGPAV